MTNNADVVSPARAPRLKDPSLQERCARELVPLLLSGLWFGCWFSLVVNFVFGVVDYFAYPQFVASFRWLRIITAAMEILALFLIRSRVGRRHPFLLSLSLVVYLILFQQSFLFIIGDPTTLYFITHCLINLGSGVLLPWGGWAMVGVSLFQVSIYLAHAMSVSGSFRWELFTLNTIILCSTAAFSCWASFRFSRMHERNFDLRVDLEESLRRVQEADRLKTQFFSNMNHELRTPLTLMLPPLEDLLGDPAYALTVKARGLLEVMERNGKRLLKLITELLDISRLDAGKLELHKDRSNLARLAGEVLARFKPFIDDKKLVLKPDIETVPDALFDVERMELVIQNLLSNAVKFTPAGGLVSVRVWAEGDGQSVEVADTGIGIALSDQGRIFDRFSQADGSVTRKFGGTGIGLSFSKELVELHGGWISVGSVPGEGARFTVWIPRPRSPDEGPTVKPRAAEVVRDWETGGPAYAPSLPAGERPLVLVIDDNDDLRTLLKSTLELHYRVALAEDGESGLEAVRRCLPDVVISDVMMPGKSGNELAAALKADPRTAMIPIIFLTAKLDSGSLVEGLSAGADDYLRKPFSPMELLARVRGQLRMRQSTQRLVERWMTGLLRDVWSGVIRQIGGPASMALAGLERIRRDAKDGKADAAVIAALAGSSLEHMDKIDRTVQGFNAVIGKGGGIEELDVRRMLEDVGWLVRPKTWDTGVSLRIGDVPEWLRVRGDARDLRRALLAVVMNAVEAAAQAAPDKREVTVDVKGSERGTTFVVSDSGPGIPAEAREKIFEPFYTTKSGNLGLGLSIARDILQDHKGSIQVDSTPGRTIVVIFLPESKT